MTGTVKNSELLSCWPDGFSRYYTVSRIIKAVFGSQHITVLDLGGDSKWMYLFLKDASVNFKLQIVDSRLPDFKNQNPDIKYTRADFFKLKMDDYKSDAVINTDVLEHIPADMEVPFVKLCIGLAKTVAIFSAPQDDAEVTESEKTINDLHKQLTGKPQKWLKEHFEFGKPKPATIRKAIQQTGCEFIELNANNLENWLLSFTCNLVNQNISTIPEMDELNRYYNQHVHKVGDFQGKPYRKVYIVFKDKKVYRANLNKIQSFFSPDDSQSLLYHGKAVSALAKKIIDLQKESQAKLKAANQTISHHQERISVLETELNKIFNKGWFRYINKIDSLLRRDK